MNLISLRRRIDLNKNIKTALTVIIAVVLVIAAFLIVSQFIGGKTRITGFDRNDVTAANFRWALFEEWVKAKPQYKGWESDPRIFKAANEEFRKSSKTNVEVVK